MITNYERSAQASTTQVVQNKLHKAGSKKKIADFVEKYINTVHIQLMFSKMQLVFWFEFQVRNAESSCSTDVREQESETRDHITHKGVHGQVTQFQSHRIASYISDETGVL